MMAAIYRRRGIPEQIARALLADARDIRRGRVAPIVRRRREVRSVIWIPAGPGSAEALWDTIDAIKASDGDASQIVVIDDWSIDARAVEVRERYPEIDVIRPIVPSGGPPAIWSLCRLALDHSLEHYAFEQWVKMDSDALVIAPGFSERTLERIVAEPSVGLAGAYRVRPDGQPEGDQPYHEGVLTRERRTDPHAAAAAASAEAAGWRAGDIVQGGVMCFTRAACEGLLSQGWASWRRPWTSIISTDLALTLFVRAAGYELMSIGGTDGIFAIATKCMPLPKASLTDGSRVAVHSLRVGFDGESEAELRAFFREQRAAWS
jgi:hypothetical protein